MNRLSKLALMAALVVAVAAAPAWAATVAVNAGAAQNGTNFGALFTLSPDTDEAYVRTDHPTAENHYLFRFWIDPTGLVDLPLNTLSTHNVRFLRVNDQDNGGGDVVRGTFLVGFITKSPSDLQYHMIFWAKQDGGTAFNSVGNLFLGNGPRQIEVEFTRADSGTTSLVMKTLDGTPQTITRNNLNLGDADVDLTDIGIFSNSNPSVLDADNKFEFDEWESFR